MRFVHVIFFLVRFARIAETLAYVGLLARLFPRLPRLEAGRAVEAALAGLCAGPRPGAGAVPSSFPRPGAGAVP